VKIKIFIDGSSRGNPGPAACAAVIKDMQGKTLSRSGKFLGKATNNTAEFYGLKLALKKAKNLKAHELTIYSDSSLLVNMFNGKYKIKKLHLIDLMFEIKGLAQNFKTIKMVHISRDLNIEADEVANMALDKFSKKHKL
jgi:ribonuclease HI